MEAETSLTAPEDQAVAAVAVVADVLAAGADKGTEQPAVAWVHAAVMLLLLAAFLGWSLWVLQADRLESSVRREYATALRSALVYMAMAVPLVWRAPWDLMPACLQNVYTSLPFWYAFVVCTSFGGWVHVARHSILGTVLAALAAFLLNYLMPGGAGYWGRDPAFVRSAWLPGGYTPLGAWVFSVVFVYLLFASRCSTGTKQYALGFYAQIIVTFMDPNQDEDAFRAVFVDYTLHVHWASMVMCQIYLIVMAVLLSALTIPAMPCRKRWSWELCSCWERAVRDLAHLSEDTAGSLERLLTYFRDEGTSRHALESSYIYIRQLGARRVALERLMDDAEWECWTSASRCRLRRLRGLAGLLRAFRQVLRVQLDHLRFGGAHAERQTAEVSLLLEDFLVACRDALRRLTQPSSLLRDQTLTVHVEAARFAHRAEEALSSALQRLALEADDSTGSPSAELAFIEGLRTCSAVIEAYLQQPAADAVRLPFLRRLRLKRLFASREQHYFALRNSTSWLAALAWSVYQRGYAASCVVGVSFIFSPTLGSLFDRNVNRMVGVAMGIVLGSLPAVMLMGSDRPGQGPLGSFNQVPQDIVIYFAAMVFLWTTAMYGYLASDAKLGYACLLWAGYGGSQMLSHLQCQWGCTASESPLELFMDMMDNLLGCLLVFVVDIVFARLVGGFTAEHVAAEVPRCFEDLAAVVESFRQGDFAGADIETLQRRIRTARFWDAEVRKEDLVWSRIWAPAYREEVVLALLEQCDNAFVAAYAVRAAAGRMPSPAAAVLVLRESLHFGLPARARLCARAARATLSEGLEAACVAIKSLTAEDSAEHREADLVPSLACEAPVWARAESDAQALASAQALRIGARKLRLALHGAEALVREHAFWASEDWHATDHFGRLRDASSVCDALFSASPNASLTVPEVNSLPSAVSDTSLRGSEHRAVNCRPDVSDPSLRGHAQELGGLSGSWRRRPEAALAPQRAA